MSDIGDKSRLKGSVLKGFDKDMEHMRENSTPSEETMHKFHLDTTKEDKGKVFTTEKIKREITQALNWEFLKNVETKAVFNPYQAVARSELLVTWRDFRGMTSTDDAVAFSLNGVKFYCPSADPVGISQVSFPLSGRTMDVIKAEHISHDGEFAEFKILEFADNAEDWVAWIENFTHNYTTNSVKGA